MNIATMYKSIRALSACDAMGENQMKILLPGMQKMVEYKAGNVADERGDTDGKLPWTDDTHEAIGVFRILRQYGTINQVELAREFAKNFKEDRHRGYGKGTAKLLFTYLYDAENWREHSENWWGPNIGSKGNGSAMRDSIIGAYFSDLDTVVREARLSAEVTHFHDEPIAASIAVAVAAWVMTHADSADCYWQTILTHTPKGTVYNSIDIVANAPKEWTNWDVVSAVGNGSQVTAFDTVAYALWEARRAVFGGSLEKAVDSIIEVGGDTDTVAAMVGGITGNRLVVPEHWIETIEPLPEDIHA